MSRAPISLSKNLTACSGIAEKRIDRERLAVGLERLRLLAERLVHEAKLFERAIMFRVSLERAIEIGKGKRHIRFLA